MGTLSYKLRSTPGSTIYDPARVDEFLPGSRAREVDEPEDEPTKDPFRYGHRYLWETTPDGREEMRQVPLTYEDTLDPQLGDYVSDNTIHNKLIGNVSGILEMRYLDDPTVAVWSNLKVRLPSSGASGGKGTDRRRKKDSPEGVKGPVPDVCVVGGVRDRDRRRDSFELDNDPGEIRLAVECAVPH